MLLELHLFSFFISNRMKILVVLLIEMLSFGEAETSELQKLGYDQEEEFKSKPAFWFQVSCFKKKGKMRRVKRGKVYLKKGQEPCNNFLEKEKSTYLKE